MMLLLVERVFPFPEDIKNNSSAYIQIRFYITFQIFQLNCDKIFTCFFPFIASIISSSLSSLVLSICTSKLSIEVVQFTEQFGALPGCRTSGEDKRFNRGIFIETRIIKIVSYSIDCFYIKQANRNLDNRKDSNDTFFIGNIAKS